MGEAQSTQDTLAGTRDTQRGFATIHCASAPLHKPPLDGALHELYGAVVLDLKALGDDPDGGSLVRAQRLEDEQELVLLWLHIGCASGGLAEREEATDLVAQVSQGLVLAGIEVTNAGRRHVSSDDVYQRTRLRYPSKRRQALRALLTRALELARAMAAEDGTGRAVRLLEKLATSSGAPGELP